MLSHLYVSLLFLSFLFSLICFSGIVVAMIPLSRPALRHIRFRNGIRLNSLSTKIATDQSRLDITDLPTNDDSPNLLKIRHSSAHIMAMAVQKLFPAAKVAIGPWIENGYENVLNLLHIYATGLIILPFFF